MNTILLGFKTHQNGKGTGSAILIAGPEVSGHEQAKIIGDAKSKNVFPVGVSLLQMSVLMPRTTAIATATTKPESKKIDTRKESK